MRPAVILLLAGAIAGGAARADGVESLCRLDGAAPDICACAVGGLNAEVGQDEYALYHRLGFDAARASERGLGVDDAFETALGAEIDRSALPGHIIERRARALRRAHRAHIAWCRRNTS